MPWKSWSQVWASGIKLPLDSGEEQSTTASPLWGLSHGWDLMNFPLEGQLFLSAATKEGWRGWFGLDVENSTGSIAHLPLHTRGPPWCLPLKVPGNTWCVAHGLRGLCLMYEGLKEDLEKFLSRHAFSLAAVCNIINSYPLLLLLVWLN